jgi:phosphate-selective porin OprO and OprP
MKLRSILLGGAALIAATAPALADDAAILKRLDALQRTMELQQRQIEAQRTEIAALKGVLKKKGAKAPVETAEAAAPSPTPIEAKVADQQVAIDALVGKFAAMEDATRVEKAEAPVLSLAGGRPTITSPDGRFSVAIRAIAQYDLAYYSQSAAAQQLAAANGPDLSSGVNFRRVQLGLQGKLFGDWSYLFNYDFAGAGGTETPGHIQAVYVEYDGLAPLAFRIGAFPPSAGLEDNTGSPDTIFLERNSPSDVARNIAGGDGRDAISVIYASERVYGALSYTGNKIQDSGSFDEQQAVMGRLSGLVYSTSDWKAVLSANGTYVFKIADTTAAPTTITTISLSDPPELTVDNTGTKFVNTGSINARSVSEWGIESAVQWRNLYGQAGYFGYGIDPRAAGAPDLGFNGWYAQATYVLTGESRNYSSSSGAFANPKPRVPFSLDGWGPGAWEIAARYSDLNLNDNAGLLGHALPVGGIRGGDQRVFTAAINWYPNSALKFELQYQNGDIDRIGTIPAGFGHGTLSNARVGQHFDTFAFRSQISF